MENNNQKILALKYRPKNFSELLGQKVMVDTISNSIKINKIPNAYLLTGIRGVGKTTTARIIAKALNCNKHFDHGNNNKLDQFCNCDEISHSKHLDILEMDAASRTGIDDVRELIESSKYNPTSAKYKIIILDEVHMLSKQAFNGLLKTLEEPPPHLKFIFATTEVKKIPVTIISRCQRFDLHRVPISTLLENLKRISKLENGKISEMALRLIANASEGSVRDSLSLLDRAIVSQYVAEKEIDENFIRKMLGMADRSKILEILHFIFQGDQKSSIEKLRKLTNEGIEPVNFLNDLLEVIHFMLQKKNIGDVDNDLFLSEAELELVNTEAKVISTSTLVIFWQFILEGIKELSIVSNQILSTEMIIMRLIHLKDIPSYQSILEMISKKDLGETTENESVNESKKTIIENENLEKNNIFKDQIKNITQTKLKIETVEQPMKKKLIEPTNKEIKMTVYEGAVEKSKTKENINSFEELINLSSRKKDIELKYDLERNVNLIKFSSGKIDIAFNEKLNKNFVRNLSERLLEWTGNRWVISLTKESGQKSFLEQNAIKKAEVLERGKKQEIYKALKDAFPDAELIDVKEKNKL